MAKETVIANIEVVERLFDRYFRCQHCGKCCTIAHSDYDGIILEDAEVKRMAIERGLSTSQFKKRFTFTADGHRFMHYPCPFWKSKCSIYRERPNVCVLYPMNIPVRENGKTRLTLNPNCTEVQALCKRFS